MPKTPSPYVFSEIKLQVHYKLFKNKAKNTIKVRDFSFAGTSLDHNIFRLGNFQLLYRCNYQLDIHRKGKRPQALRNCQNIIRRPEKWLQSGLPLVPDQIKSTPESPTSKYLRMAIEFWLTLQGSGGIPKPK